MTLFKTRRARIARNVTASASIAGLLVAGGLALHHAHRAAEFQAATKATTQVFAHSAFETRKVAEAAVFREARAAKFAAVQPYADLAKAADAIALDTPALDNALGEHGERLVMSRTRSELAQVRTTDVETAAAEVATALERHAAIVAAHARATAADEAAAAQGLEARTGAAALPESWTVATIAEFNVDGLNNSAATVEAAVQADKDAKAKAAQRNRGGGSGRGVPGNAQPGSGAVVNWLSQYGIVKVDASLGGYQGHVSTAESARFCGSLLFFEYWKYTHLTVDVVPGRGAGFSVESPTGKRFIIRSRMLNDAELEYFGLGPTA